MLIIVEELNAPLDRAKILPCCLPEVFTEALLNNHARQVNLIRQPKGPLRFVDIEPGVRVGKAVIILRDSTDVVKVPMGKHNSVDGLRFYPGVP